MDKKKYVLPEFDLLQIDKLDIITTSAGVNAPLEDDPFGEWEL